MFQFGMTYVTPDFDQSVVAPLIGESVSVPPALAALLARPAHAEPMPPDYAVLCEHLLR